MNPETLFTRALARLRKICLAFPESSEKLAWALDEGSTESPPQKPSARRPRASRKP